MKASKSMKMANELKDKIDALLSPISEALEYILDDQSAHVLLQGGDGFVVAYNGGMDNAIIHDVKDMDSMLNMGKNQLLQFLDGNRV